MPDFGNFAIDEPPPNVGPKPSSPTATGFQSHQTPQIRLPGVDGREAFDDWDGGHGETDSRNSLPSRQSVYQGGNNATAGSADDDWAKDAGMFMNLAGTLGKREV
jgi:hypothetical protein